MDIKILCMYLPQFHEVDENNNWWGKGYTEWTAVKRAKSLFKEHKQPRIPLGGNYYDLADKSAQTWRWQSELANEYGVYGFCVYHYWFNGKLLLQKPLEILLAHPEININYCICWANESWTRTWYGDTKDVLMKQEYGSSRDWENHFEYLLAFFNDERYIKIDNKPMLNIYMSSDIIKLGEMIECWNTLARKVGFSGVYIVCANNHGKLETRDELVDAYYNFEPGYTLKHKFSIFHAYRYNVNVFTRRLINKLFKDRLIEHVIDARTIYKMMFKNIQTTEKPVFPGAFVMWDNTPRVSYRGLIYKNTTPVLFYKTLHHIKMNQKINDPNNFVYVNAWNEWGEGCYLEPDTSHKYKYLEMVKRVVDER